MPQARTARTTSAAAASAARSCKNRTFFWFATESYHDVQTRNASVLMPTDGRARRRLLASRPMRPASRSSSTTRRHAHAVPGQHHPGRPHQPGRGGDAEVPAAARRRASTTAARTTTARRSSTTSSSSIYSGQGRSQVHRQGLAERLLPLQPDRTSRARTTSAPPTRTSRTASPTRTTTSSSGGRRFSRSTTPGCSSDNSVLALRFGMTRFPDNNTLSVDFDPATLGFSQTYLNQITLDKFPQVRIRGYDQFASPHAWRDQTRPISTGSRRAPTAPIRNSSGRTRSSRRRLPQDRRSTTSSRAMARASSTSTRTSPRRTAATSSTTDGNAFASFLLGYPVGAVDAGRARSRCRRR